MLVFIVESARRNYGYDCAFQLNYKHLNLKYLYDILNINWYKISAYETLFEASQNQSIGKMNSNN